MVRPNEARLDLARDESRERASRRIRCWIGGGRERRVGGGCAMIDLGLE